MTRDEALTILKQSDRVGCNIIQANDEETTEYNLRSMEALNMAIKALEQEPCEDAISRQAVLDEMYKRKANDDAITAGFIKNLPSVTPQLSAHWILYRDHKNMIDYPQCDNCNAVIKLPLPIDNLNFCPNCGRIMEEDKNICHL